jgi:hypothetical protein
MVNNEGISIEFDTKLKHNTYENHIIWDTFNESNNLIPQIALYNA